MPLTLLTRDGTTKPPPDPLPLIEEEVERALSLRLQTLRGRLLETRRLTESALYRLQGEGPDLTLEDLEPPDLRPLMAEIRVLQDLKQFIEALK